MSKELCLALAIIILLVLLIVFVVSFVLYKKTPVPEGCENISINEENCAACKNTNCEFFHKKDGK